MYKKSSFSLLSDCYTDAHAYGHFLKDQEDAMIEDYLFNKLRGKAVFNAICLSGGATAENKTDPTATLASYYPIRVRPIDIHDFIIPDPCGKEYANQSACAKRLIDMHPLAYGVRPLAYGERTPGFGDIITCRFVIAGPKDQGKLRGIRYDFPKANTTYNYECANAELQSLVGQFYSLPYQLANATVPAGTTTDAPAGAGSVVSNGTKIRGGLNFTWTQLKELAQLGIFEPLLAHIRDHECSLAGCAKRNFNSNQYDAFNFKGGYRMGNTKYLPKPLSQYTIEQVRSHWQAKSSVKGHKMFATGGYQIIPKTLKSAIRRIKGLNTGDIYNKLHQDALGIYLVTMKRKTLGKYLFGSNVNWKSAGNELAFEFASVRLQRAASRDGKMIPAYVKYYGGVGSNKAGAVNKADADRTMAAINTVRKAIDGNARAREIRDLALK